MTATLESTLCNGSSSNHRRLSDYTSSSKKPPSYMNGLMDDLKARKKLMEETPLEEVKYWFEYTGPLQVRSTHFIICHCFTELVKKDGGEWGRGGGVRIPIKFKA